ncbi:MAG TPA: phosphoribosyltransferase [Chloroflexia bacterium]|nr:phosphoribosyltransferase [Chloroflexia bacterium]
MRIVQFENRQQAGKVLATRLKAYANRPDVVVLALPRGGVPVAYQVAMALNVPLDIIVVRKLGLPGQEELAMGAIASGGVCVLNQELVADLYISDQTIERVARVEEIELKRREQRYRAGRPPLEVKGKIVILVDDGLATGTTMLAAITALKKQEIISLVVAVPIAPYDTFHRFQPLVDQMVSVITPGAFFALGYWYREFSQTSDEEVCWLLEQAARRELARRHTERVLTFGQAES